MSWFDKLMGFQETSPEAVRSGIVVDGVRMKSESNGRVFECGRLEILSLAELRHRVASAAISKGKLKAREIVADVQSLHADSANAGAIFQVASQFNLLEMVAPDVTPDEGVGIYENDRTQGPACAIAAGAGTIFRNYFVSGNGRQGQSADNQIDCLSEIGRVLGNADGELWQMKNGYALPTASGLQRVSAMLSAMDEQALDSVRQELRIGLQWNTQVTLADCTHLVTQAYCSALPVAYSSLSEELWAPWACMVLDAAYEATLLAAVLNRIQTGNRKVFLTLLGGGAFGNAEEWILQAIGRALELFAATDLDVAIVSYRASNPRVAALVQRHTSGAH